VADGKLLNNVKKNKKNAIALRRLKITGLEGVMLEMLRCLNGGTKDSRKNKIKFSP
jgi:hypothetical protein